MRSARDLRERRIELVARIMERTGMYATTGREMQLLASHLLGDLCFLDGREAGGEQEQSRLRSFGERGVAGPFEALFGSPRCQAEVAAVYAEVFRRLGYAIGDPVAPRRWRDMTADRDADPLVRSVWVSGPDFEAGLILYGKTLRWGPGWWTQHPGDGWPAHTRAIAAQLRDISAADPPGSPQPQHPARSQTITPSPRRTRHVEPPRAVARALRRSGRCGAQVQSI